MTSNFKNSMYPQSFLCEEAKIKQHNSLKKKLCEVGEGAIWESRFTCFLTAFFQDVYIFLFFGIITLKKKVVESTNLVVAGCHSHKLLRECEIPWSVSKTVNNFFRYGLQLRPKKKQHIQQR